MRQLLRLLCEADNLNKNMKASGLWRCFQLLCQTCEIEAFIMCSTSIFVYKPHEFAVLLNVRFYKFHELSRMLIVVISLDSSLKLGNSSSLYCNRHHIHHHYHRRRGQCLHERYRFSSESSTLLLQVRAAQRTPRNTKNKKMYLLKILEV
jgi:hypothetical protein